MIKEKSPLKKYLAKDILPRMIDKNYPLATLI